MISSNHWKFWLVLFPIIGTCALANFPGGMKGFFAAWYGAPKPISWTPANLTNAVSWWTVTDESTITLISGTNRVSEWRDKVGTNHFTQTNASYRPAYLDDVVTSQKVISFNQIDYNLNLSYDIGGKSNKFFYIVYRVLTTGNRTIFILDSGNYTYLQYGNTFYVGNNTQTVGINTNGFEMRGAFTGTSGVSVVRYSNAVAQTSTSIDAAQGFDRLGSEVGFNQNPNMNVREIVFISGNLSIEDRQKLEGYLAHNNDIEDKLPSDHPYRNSPP